MLVETGFFALISAMVLALGQLVYGWLGGGGWASNWQRPGAAWHRTAARRLAVGQFAALSLSWGALVLAFVRSDFSVRLVMNHSHTDQPLLYRVTASWGNHEGSILLWALILSLYGMLFAVGERKLSPRLHSYTLAVQGFLSLSFLLYAFLVSNPFRRLFPAPLEGLELNPLLQDPGLAFHPPTLYAGYVGLSLVFALAAGVMLDRGADKNWPSALRVWALVSWSFLTAGIALGSWWAYYELGWGGFWFWDPVENASLMPWLAATGLIHSLAVMRRRGIFASWTLFLAVLAYGLSLLGTFIVRSGLLTSVHAFADNPSRGLYLLLILSVTTLGALGLFVFRGHKAFESPPAGTFHPLSREAGLVLNNGLLCTALGVVFIGTFYPFFAELFASLRLSVGPSYFAISFIPIFVIIAFLIGFVPFSRWRLRPRWRGNLALWAGIFGGLFSGFLILSDFQKGVSVLGIGLACWVIGPHLYHLGPFLKNPRRFLATEAGSTLGMALGHMGFGFLILGVLGATLLAQEQYFLLSEEKTFQAAGRHFRLEKLETVTQANYEATRAEILETDADGTHILNRFYPERRFYAASRQSTTEAWIISSLKGDSYFALGAQREDGQLVVRYYRKPLALFLWFGAMVMTAGGLWALGVGVFASRRRLGRGRGGHELEGR